MLRSTQVLLESADFDTATIEDIASQVAREEQAQLQRAQGRIESRQRFKHKSPHPLLDQRTESLLFIDESGHPAPQSTVRQPVLALGAISMTPAEMSRYTERADALKRRFFDPPNITFHEPPMRRHAQVYSFGGDRERQRAFGQAVADLVASTEFVAFGAAIRKDAFAREFTEAGLDPYLPASPYAVAITMLLERYVDYLLTAEGPRQIGKVTFESQGAREDAEHQVQFARLLLDGTQWVPESAFQQAIHPGASFVPKSGSHPTELADMFARDLYEWARSGCRERPLRWSTFTRKTYCRGDGSSGKFGVKVFPDSDIREAIELHREERLALGAN